MDKGLTCKNSMNAYQGCRLQLQNGAGFFHNLWRNIPNGEIWLASTFEYEVLVHDHQTCRTRILHSVHTRNSPECNRHPIHLGPQHFPGEYDIGYSSMNAPGKNSKNLHSRVCWCQATKYGGRDWPPRLVSPVTSLMVMNGTSESERFRPSSHFCVAAFSESCPLNLLRQWWAF
ncbi:hypothetical protein K439DRAFT_1638497 [Ramaria rubella]|nr:hypothetical protein K439DRAFT_1638497 [Ramaria rubella]